MTRYHRHLARTRGIQRERRERRRAPWIGMAVTDIPKDGYGWLLRPGIIEQPAYASQQTVIDSAWWGFIPRERRLA